MEIKSAVRSHCKTLQSKCLACGNTRVCQIKSLVASMTVVCGGLNTQRGRRAVHERVQPGSLQGGGDEREAHANQKHWLQLLSFPPFLGNLADLSSLSTPMFLQL